MVEDLLYKWANEWFGKYHPEVAIVEECNSPGSAHGFIGRTDSGQHVTFVSLAALSDFAKRDRVKPLLVLSFRQSLTNEQVDRINYILAGELNSLGWSSFVVDCMDEAKVQGFWVDLPTLDTLSFDSIITLLDGLKRVREVTQWDTRFNS